MDILADILKQAGLQRRILNQRSFFEPMAIEFPCDKSIGFHVVTSGEAFLHTGTNKIIHLKKGDIAMMARGCRHIVSTEEKYKTKVIEKAQLQPELVYDAENRKSQLTLVSGAYQFWNNPVHPFFKELPDWYILRSEDLSQFDQLQLSVNLLSDEVAKPQIGSERIIQNLLDIMFSFIIRKIILQNSEKSETWSHAIQDVQIRKAIELLHADCAKSWSLDDLAKHVGLSRAGFAQKFKKSLGDTPLHYLTTIRVQKAMDLLSNTSETIEVVAESVGYKDAFSFSKVFKKIAGVPPRDFRIKDKEEKNLSWRYKNPTS